MTFTAKVEDLEIRGSEVRVTKKEGDNSKYALVKFDNPAGDRLEFIDRDEERFDYYKRGQMCDIWIRVQNTAKYTNFTIIDMCYKDAEEDKA